MSSLKYYIPELEYYFFDYWYYYGQFTEIPFNKSVTEDDTDLYIDDGGLFDLLFSSSYSYPKYTYLFSRESKNLFSPKIEDRLKVTSYTVQPLLLDSCANYYVSDSTNEYVFSPGETTKLGYNVINIEDDDITMLELLRRYKSSETISLDNIEYNNLTTVLSKLIYQFLDLKINDNYDIIDKINILSEDITNLTSRNLIELFYELYLMNECYRDLKVYEDIVDSNYIKLRQERDVISVTESIINNELFETTYVVYTNGQTNLFHNGELQETTVYSVVNDGTNSTVSWSSQDLTLLENDKLIFDYYVEVS